MYFVALATDYDGTLAEDGSVAEDTVATLRSFKQSGRKLILVTGRELSDLRRVFSHLDLFDAAVVENGAVLVDPATAEEIPLGEEPPPLFIEELRRRNVTPLSVGRSIVATWEPNEKVVLDTIRDLGLELQIVFNKGAVMVLPAGINKASGLATALARLQLSPLNVVGIGDAEKRPCVFARMRLRRGGCQRAADGQGGCRGRHERAARRRGGGDCPPDPRNGPRRDRSDDSASNRRDRARSARRAG